MNTRYNPNRKNVTFNDEELNMPASMTFRDYTQEDKDNAQSRLEEMLEDVRQDLQNY